MIDSKSYKKYFLTILSGNALSQLIPFLLIPFIARIFAKEEIATSANWLAMASLIGILATGRLDVAIPIPKSQKEARFVYTSGLIITIGITALSFLALIFKREIANWYNDPYLEELIWLLPIGVASAGLIGVASNWALRNRQYKRVTTGKIVQAILNNLLAVFLGYLTFGAFGLIVAWVVSQYANVFILMQKAESYSPRLKLDTMDWKFFRRIVRKYKEFPLVNSLHAFVDVFSTQFLLFYLITAYFSKEELALYYLMYRYVRAPITLITSSVYQLYYVEVNKLVQQQEKTFPMAVKTIKTAAIFAIPFFIFILALGPTVFGWYLGEDWRESGVYAQIFAPVFFLMFFSSPLSGTPLIFNRQKTAFAFSIATYASTLGIIYYGHLQDWNFSSTLMSYCILLASSYLLHLFWYLYLLKKNDKLLSRK